MLTTVKLSQIIHDPKVQARVSINDALVHDLTDAYERDDEIPPPVLFTEDDKNFYCADGHHRLCALVNLEVVEWPCEVRQGTKEDAFVFNVVTNGGPRALPMTRADKRKAARLAIDLWGSTMSDRMIADKIKISNATVSDVRKEMGLESPAPKKNKPKPKPDAFNLTHTPPKEEHAVEPPAIEVEKDDGESEGEMDSFLASAERQPEVTVVASALDMKGEKKAIAESLDAVISNIGKAVRAADDANQNRKHPTHHKIVLMMLNKALEEVKKWKGALQ